MRQCLEYLLGVAESIIKKSSATNIYEKYILIKEQALQQYELSRQSFQRGSLMSKSRNKQNCSSKVLRASIASMNHQPSVNHLPMKKNLKRHKNSQTSSVSRLNRKSEPVSSMYSSGHQPKAKYQNQVTNILSEMATVLTNAEQYPEMLTKITLIKSVKSVSQNLKELVTSIQNSLAQIHKKLSLENLTIEKVDILPIQYKAQELELITDNRWLVEKLQKIVQENILLRRMVGSKA